MSGPCPDSLTLRIFAEGELDGAARVAEHVAVCSSCRLLVDRARREESVLRETLRAEMPPSLHAEVLRALDRHVGSVGAPGEVVAAVAPSSAKMVSETSSETSSGASVAGLDARRRGSSRRLVSARGARSSPARDALLLLASLGLVAATALAVYSSFRHAAVPEGSGDMPSGSAGVSPAVVPTAPQATEPPVALPAQPATPHEAPARGPTLVPGDLGPPSSASPDPSAPATEDPGLITKAPAVTPRADESPAPPVQPTPALPGPNKPDAERPVAELALAVLRSGKVSSGGKALAAGDVVPEGDAVEVGSLVELESTDSVKLLVASGSKLSVKRGDRGEPVFFLSSGKVFARSAGKRGYAIASADARTTPLGTEFVVSVELGKTRVSTLEGRVRVDVERAPVPGGGAVDVRAGFEADVVKGKSPEVPHPFAAAHTVSWLPDGVRPKTLPAQPRVVRVFNFEDGEGFNQGVIVPGGAHGSKHALKGALEDEGSMVELSDERAQSLDFDPNLWVEVTCKVDKAAAVVLEVVGGRKKMDHAGPGGPGGPRFGEREVPKNLELRTRVEAGRWVTIAAPVRDFLDVADFRHFAGPGGPRHPGRDIKPSNHVERFAVFAMSKGETVELLVDDVRFFYEE
jgi:hypothetical protein